LGAVVTLDAERARREAAGADRRLARVLRDTPDERGGVIAGERVHDVNGPARRSRAGLVFRVSP
jgi:hypothetical protein